MPALYKFIADADAVRFLLAGAVKFTPIPELNDPSELIPSMDTAAVVESLGRLRGVGYSDEDMVHLRQQENLLQVLAPECQAIPVPSSKSEASRILHSPFYDSIPRLEHLLNKAAQEMSSKVGLLCLSTRCDSLPMWAHYAANAAGLAIEFRGLEKFFQGDDTDILRRVTPVCYQREAYGVTFDSQSHKSLFFSKFQDWSYEQEARVVLPLSECRMHSTAAGPLFLYDIPPTCVARLILGWHMSSEAIAKVEQCVRDINASVEVVHAKFIRGRITFGS